MVTSLYCNKSIELIYRLAEIKDFRFVFDKYGPMWASVPTIVTYPTNGRPMGAPTIQNIFNLKGD